MFPVSRVGKKKPVGRSGIFFFSNFIFYKLECTGGKREKKKNLKIGKKKFQSALFSPPGRWTGNDFLFEDGLMTCSYQRDDL